MGSDRSRRSTSTSAPPICLVCGDPVGGTNPLCSRACLLDARRELEENLLVLGQERDSETRTSLMERNGDLTAAVIGWAP